MKKIYLVPVILCIFLIIFIYFFNNNNHFTWESETDRTKYSNTRWDTITMSFLDGFKPQVTLIQKNSRENSADWEKLPEGHKGSRRGGMLPTFYWYEEESNSNKKITSIEELRLEIAPIETEKEAVSFITAFNPNIKLDNDLTITAYVSVVESGFLVKILQQEQFGCGNHLPYYVIYKVSNSGDITKLAQEIRTGGSPMCVD